MRNEDHVYTLRFVDPDRFCGAEIGLADAEKTARLMARVHDQDVRVVYNAREVVRFTPFGRRQQWQH